MGVADLLRETGVAVARSCPCGVETGVAFAGEKWLFFVCFLVAEVLSVSMVAVQGRAVVMAVSRWPASVVAEVSLVSKPPCRCVLCAKFFALWCCHHRVGAKKFAQRAHNTPISAFLGVLGEFFRGSAAGGAALGELFRGSAAGGAVLGELFRARRRHSVSTAHRYRAHADAVSARTAGPIRPLKRGDQGPYDGVTAKRSVVIIAQ